MPRPGGAPRGVCSLQFRLPAFSAERRSQRPWRPMAPSPSRSASASSEPSLQVAVSTPRFPLRGAPRGRVGQWHRHRQAGPPPPARSRGRRGRGSRGSSPEAYCHLAWNRSRDEKVPRAHGAPEASASLWLMWLDLNESCCQDNEESAEHSADATKSQVGALAAL